MGERSIRRTSRRDVAQDGLAVAQAASSTVCLRSEPDGKVRGAEYEVRR